MSIEHKLTGNAGSTKLEGAIPSAANDEKLGPCFEFEFVFLERDTDTGKSTHRISTRVRVPVNPMVNVATRSASAGFSKEAEITIAAHIYKIEHLCDDVHIAHPGPVTVTKPIDVPGPYECTAGDHK